MKTIGLVGGMTWHSTVEYYKDINELVQLKLGEDHSARILMSSLDFNEIRILRDTSRFVKLAEILADASKKLEAAGADAILLCANTAHKFIPEIENQLRIPILHIGDAIGSNAKSLGFGTVGFLGTRLSMKETFVTAAIEKYGVNVILPAPEYRKEVDVMIANESPPHRLSDDSETMIQTVLHDLVARGSKGIVLGCTELPLMIPASFSSVPLIDSAKVHAAAAVDFMLKV